MALSDYSTADLEKMLIGYGLPLPSMAAAPNELSFTAEEMAGRSLAEVRQDWYRSALINTLGQREAVRATGGLVPGDPGFLVRTTGGRTMPTNGYSAEPPMLIGPPATGSPAPAVDDWIGPALFNGSGGGRPVAIQAIGPAAVAVPAITAILGALGVSAATIALWLPRILALVGGGMAIVAAIAAVSGRSSADVARVAGGAGGVLQGPGVPEPRPGTYSKTWRTSFEQPGTFLNGYTWFWKMLDGSVVYYSSTGKSGKYRPKKPVAVIMSGGATKLNQAIRAQRHLDRLWRTVAKRTKALKLA